MRPFVIARIWVGPTLPMLSGGMAKAVSESWMPRKLVPMAWGLNRRPGAAPASGGHWDTAAAGTRCRGGSSFRRSTSGLTSRPRDRSSGAAPRGGASSDGVDAVLALRPGPEWQDRLVDVRQMPTRKQMHFEISFGVEARPQHRTITQRSLALNISAGGILIEGRDLELHAG